jgi:hypothetical protein
MDAGAVPGFAEGAVKLSHVRFGPIADIVAYCFK